MQTNDVTLAKKAEVAANSSFPGGKLVALVEDGMVTLCGEVDWHYQRDAALAAVRALPGSRNVVAQMLIKGVAVSAADVRKCIERTIRRQIRKGDKSMVIEASEGKVFLSGTVLSWEEHDEAELAAWFSPGVAWVQNDLEVIRDGIQGLL